MRNYRKGRTKKEDSNCPPSEPASNQPGPASGREGANGLGS